MVISGEENALDFTLLNMESMTVKEMMDVIKTMDDDVNMKYKTTETVVFPPLKEKFKGKKWSLLIARNELTTCLTILGFGKGGVKNIELKPMNLKVGQTNIASWTLFTLVMPSLRL